MADLGSTKVFGDLTVAGDIRIGDASVIDTINAGDNTAVKLTGNQTVAGVKTFSSTITGSVSGNAATATKLATARTIAGVSFDGTANISLTAANVGAIATTGGTSTGNITAPDFIQSSTQSTNAAACTRKDYVDSAIAAGDALQVSKTGDTMTGDLSFDQAGRGVRLSPGGDGTGVYHGNGDGATQDATNLQIKSWQGIGISPTAGLPAGMTMGQNSIWINARSGNIETIGKTTQNQVVIKGSAPANYFIETDSATQKTYIQVVDSGSFRLHEDNTSTTEASLIFHARVDKRFEIRNPVSSTAQISDINALTRKDYVDGEIAKQVAKTGDTMTGNLTTPKVLVSDAQGTEVNALTRRDYVDSAIAAGDALQVSKAGDTMTGNLTAPLFLMSSAQSTAVNASTRKDYVDSAIAAGDALQVSKTGDTMTGALAINRDSAHLNFGLADGVRKWHQEVGLNGSFAVVESDKAVRMVFNAGGNGTLSGNWVANKFTMADAQGTGAGDATRKDYVDSAIATGDALQVSKSGDTMTGNLTAPAVLVSSAQDTSVNALTRKDYVDSATALKVSKAGDSMTGTLTTPKVLVSGEQGTEVNALTRRDYVNAELAKKLDLTGGTLTGNLTTPKVLVSGAQGAEGNALTRKDYVDASDAKNVAKAGDTMTGGMTFTFAPAVGAATSHIFHNGNGTTGTQINIRSMRESTGSTWLWEKVADGNLYYSTGTTGAGTNKIRMNVSGGEIYLGNADQRAYHQGFKPTAADIGALQAGATAVAATKLATASTIGGVAFDGTANINLPGVNTAGNQSTTGNAATATKLATARTIAGVSFDGTANISLTAANVGALPSQAAGGVLEIGKYIDFHDTGTSVDFSARFYCNGSDLVATGNIQANDFYVLSDSRLKSNLVSIPSAMSKVRQLSGYTYDKKASLASEQFNREAGIVAQQLQQVLPEAVVENTETGILTVSPQGVSALLVEAMKELSEEVQQLKATIEELRNGSTR